MNILIVSYFNSWITHFATELEIAQVHLDRGDRVEFLVCDASLTCCEANPDGLVHRCDRCRLRRSEALKLLTTSVREHALGDYLPAGIKGIEDEMLARLGTVEQAESYTYEGHDLGNAALSSAIWDARDPLCESPRAFERMRRYAVSSLRSYLGVKAFLQRHAGFERVYVFNGRFASARGALRACQEISGLEVFTHERGANIGKYATFRNTLVHDRALWTQNILDSWNQAEDPRRATELGSQYFVARRNGVNEDWVSYIQQQSSGKLPASWDRNQLNIAIFNSSEDEFVGLGKEWKNPIYETQSDGIRRIVEDSLARHPNAKFYLRVHPNLTGVDNQDTRRIAALAGMGLPNLEVIPADSDICSYSLVDACDKAITFGSTMGAEATFWGKVSLLAGHSFYGDIDAAYKLGSHQELVEMIGCALEPKPQVNAIKYGHYLMTFGDDFKYWKATGFSSGTFMGRDLGCEPRSMFVRRLMLAARDLRRRA